MEEKKAGWKTTEFWLAIGTTLISFLAATGILNNTDVIGLQNHWATIIQSIAAAIVSSVYIAGRVAIKKSESKKTEDK